ncbi:LysE family transporter [Pseudooceanicola sp. GBMRC 2024]|uniref:LysE family transporter n=2 Tax=Paracoccaceae TaxID=31989 RepID=A0A6L7G6Q2_9RHOB|nr:LysE family transporter [Pseudooceanicola albus]
MGVALGQGRARAVALACGVVSGSVIWGLLAATGLSAVLVAYAQVIVVLKIAGGLYLLFLAWKSARAALGPGPAARGQAALPRAVLYRRGVLMHLTNPKAILGWMAIMTLGLTPGAPPMTLAAILAGCAVLSAAVNLGYALVFSAPALGHGYLRLRRWIEGTLALVFGYAGLRLLLSRP